MELSTLRRQSGVAFLPVRVKQFLSTFFYGSYAQSLYINYWSILHGVNGMLTAALFWFYRVPVSRWLWYGFFIHLAWELWQVITGWSYPLHVTGDSNVVDTYLDTFFFFTGIEVIKWLLGKRKPGHP